jgi:hypothetical protein
MHINRNGIIWDVNYNKILGDDVNPFNELHQIERFYLWWLTHMVGMYFVLDPDPKMKDKNKSFVEKTIRVKAQLQQHELPRRSTPCCFIFTKNDKYENQKIKKDLPQLIQWDKSWENVISPVEFFTCSAVGSVERVNGTEIPPLPDDLSPKGVLEPIDWMLGNL